MGLWDCNVHSLIICGFIVKGLALERRAKLYENTAKAVGRWITETGYKDEDVLELLS
jgi:hypothetical protein